jgi:hypothetical protein
MVAARAKTAGRAPAPHQHTAADAEDEGVHVKSGTTNMAASTWKRQILTGFNL